MVLTITKFNDGDLARELSNDFKKFMVADTRTVKYVTKNGIQFKPVNRRGFILVDELTFSMIGDKLVEGADYNAIMAEYDEAPLSITYERSFTPFWDKDEPVVTSKGEDVFKNGKKFFRRPVLTPVGTEDTWGTVAFNEKGNAIYTEDKSVIEMTTVAEEATAHIMVEQGDLV